MPDATPTPTPTPAPAPAPADIPADNTPLPADGETPETIPPRHVPVGELAEERQKRHTAEEALAAEQAKVKVFEDANKTQAERDTEAHAALEKSSAQNAAKALRYEVAAEKGIPLTAAARLVGTSREEIAADADRFLTDFPNLLVAPTRIPAPDPGQGPRPNEPKSDGDQAYEDIYGPPKP